MLMLAGCAPVAWHDDDLATLQPDHVRFEDARACDGQRICWPWQTPHRATIYRNIAGDVTIWPEAANGPGIGELADPVESAFSHFTYGVGIK